MVKAIASALIWGAYIFFSCCFVQFCLHGGNQALFGDPGFAVLAAFISALGFFAGYFIRYRSERT